MWSATTETCRSWVHWAGAGGFIKKHGSKHVRPGAMATSLVFFIPSPVTGGPVGRAFWGHTSETSTLVWWIFWPPTPRNNGWLLRCLSLVLPKMLLYFSYIFSGTLKAWNCRISGTINAVGRCVSMAKSFGTFCSSAARDLGWGMHGDASKNEFRLCSSSTQRLVQQIKGFTKPFFSVVNCSALMGRWITVEISPWHLCPSICIHLRWLGLTWRLGK